MSGGAPEHDLSAGAVPSGARSIESYFTDGSFVRLLAQLSHLAGVPIELRSIDDHAIIADHGPVPWTLEPRASQPPEGAEVIPLEIAGVHVGSLAVAPGEPKTGTGFSRRDLIETVGMVARTATEVILGVAETEHRIHELDVLYRLTSTLVRARTLEAVLETALDAALDVLDLEAGSIVVLPEVALDAAAEDDDAPETVGATGQKLFRMETASEEVLMVMAARGLSRAWLDHPESLSEGGRFDRDALEGEPVAVEDLLADDRVQIRDFVESEGLRSFVVVGMRFRARHLGAIRLYGREPRMFTNGEKRLLESIAQQAAVAVEQARLMETRRREQIHQRQLRLAADVQRRMLPDKFPSFKGLDVAARYEPSLELAGDFYDVFELGLTPPLDGLAAKTGLGLVVGDVVGKGVPAALLMSLVRATLRAEAEHTHDLAQVVRRVNQSMCRDTLANEFATLWFGVVEPEQQRLWFCGAGHDPPMILRVPPHRAPTAADLDDLATGGLVVGIDPSQRYQVTSCDLHPGDVLVAYSDGVTDARNFDGERYGKDRLRASLIKNLALEPDLGANGLADRLMWDVRRFVGLTDRVDDQTLVVLRTDRA